MVQEEKLADAARVTPCLMKEFSTRHILNNEVHSRPFIQVGSPTRCCHMAILTGEAGQNADLEHLAALCRHYNLPTPPADSKHQIIDFGTFRLKWERHTEFCSYTFLRKGKGDDPFKDTALSVVPEEWIKSVPGELLVGVHLFIDRIDEDQFTSRDYLENIFGDNLVVGARAGSSGTQILTDFQIHGDGFSRILVNDSCSSETQAGRLVQRLLEIETYRMMAMLAMPLTGEISQVTREVEQELADVVQQMMDLDDPAREHEVLDRLTRMAARVEHLSAGSTFRFNATKAYYTLVEKRIDNIKEVPLTGFQTVSSFLQRRIAPRHAHLCQHGRPGCKPVPPGEPGQYPAANPHQHHPAGPEQAVAGKHGPARPGAAAPAADGGRPVRGRDQLLCPGDYQLHGPGEQESPAVP